MHPEALFSTSLLKESMQKYTFKEPHEQSQEQRMEKVITLWKKILILYLSSSYTYIFHKWDENWIGLVACPSLKYVSISPKVSPKRLILSPPCKWSHLALCFTLFRSIVNNRSYFEILAYLISFFSSCCCSSIRLQ